jgi:hypothetical protein
VRQVCAPRKALPETTLYIPLQFWYCRNPGLALPLIALQYHEVKINLDIRNIEECLWAVSSLDGNGGKINEAYKQSLAAASLFVDYIFLDTDERRRMAQNPHEYLIEQLQFTGDESVGSSSNKIKLNLNHPCKELIWVVQPDANVDYCASLVAGTALNTLLGAQPFNYTDALDALPNAVHAFGSKATINGANGFITPSGGFEDMWANQLLPATGQPDVATRVSMGPNRGDVTIGPIAGGLVAGSIGGTTRQYGPDGNNNTEDSGVSDAGTFVLAETALDMHCWGENPVVVAKLQLNGQDRFSEREGTYFDLVQPYQHHTRAPDTGINVYSFALRPEEHQPSGTCNFSRIDNATLQLVLSNATVQGVNTAKVRVYAINYNVLRIMSGMGGLAYSN